jgi:hypothetical protein
MLICLKPVGVAVEALNNHDAGLLAPLVKSLMERYFKGKCILTEEMHREEDLNVVMDTPT